MVVTRHDIYIFEIKNYVGHLEYAKHQWKLYGKPIGQNPITQVQKKETNLTSILGRKVNNVLLFIGESNTVEVSGSIANVEIITRAQLRQFIWKMVQDERRCAGYPLDTNEIMERLSDYEIQKSSRQKGIPEGLKQSMRKGICCCYCGNFEVETSKI